MLKVSEGTLAKLLLDVHTLTELVIAEKTRNQALERRIGELESKGGELRVSVGRGGLLGGAGSRGGSAVYRKSPAPTWVQTTLDVADAGEQSNA